MVKPYKTYMNLATTIPGVNDLFAIWIIAEIGVDMSVFPSPEHLASCAGYLQQITNQPEKRKA